MKMEKKLIIVSLILLSLFMIGAVSAASNTTDVVNSDVNDEKVSHTTTDTSSENVAKKSTDTVSEKKSISTNEKEEDDKLSSTNNEVLKETDNGTFTALNNKISTSNNEITLENDYTYDNTDNFPDGITINKDITIHGNGKTINANGKSRVFYITGGNIIIENLNLINGYRSVSGDSGSRSGGAIRALDGSIVTINYCNFTNNTANWRGGAIATESQMNITNSIFTQNTVTNTNEHSGGGAIYNGGNLTIIKSMLNNNTAQTHDYNRGGGGGAILTWGDNLTLKESVIINNKLIDATARGSAITIGNAVAFINITNNIFLNNEGQLIHLWASSANFNFDYNWMGNTADNYTNEPTLNTDIDNWLFLNATAVPDTINGLGGFSDIVFKLYLYNESTNNVSAYDNSKLSPINLTITPTKGETVNTVQLGEAIQYQSTESGKGNITASIGDISYTKEVNIISNNSFTALYKNITKYNTITLNHDYTYDPNTDTAYTDGMEINKELTIIGNGHTISGNNSARIFKVNRGNLILENLTLKNGKANNGGAIYGYAYYITINNCTFINNTATRDGGAIACDNTGLTLLKITQSTFINNNATVLGGAIYTMYASVNIESSLFIDNKGKRGSAISGNDPMGYININHNIFLNNGEMALFLEYAGPINSDYNWFGSTLDNYTVNPNPGNTNWLFLNGTAYPNPVQVLNTTNITFKLSLYNSSSKNVTIYDNSQLKPVNLTITYTNSDVCENIAKLNETISYTPNNIGTASVTASISNAEYTINLTVTQIPTNITVNTDPITLNVTDTSQIFATLEPSDAGSLTYNSSNETVVTVDNNGNIVAVGQGIANITVSFAGQGNYAAAISKIIQVIVNLKDASVSVNNDTLDLFVGDEFTIVATTTPEVLNVTYIPDNSGIVTVDENGKITALKEGTAQITVKINGKGIYFENSTTVTVTVSKIPSPTPSPSNPTITPTKTVYQVKIYLTLKKVKKISKKTRKLYLKVIVKRNGKKILTKKITIKVKRNKVKAKKTNKNKAKNKKLSKVQGFKFTVKINNKTYAKKTNKKGKITYTITNLYKKGTYKAKISYKSKYYYKNNGKNIKFKIKA